jgi:uncharacterized protein (DUF1499 family)
MKVYFGIKRTESSSPEEKPMILAETIIEPVSIIAVVLFCFVLVLFFTRNFPPKKPASIGIQSGSLALCGNKPNCVCSLDNRPNHMILPLDWAGSEAMGIEKIEEMLSFIPGNRVVSKSGNYLHAEFRTPLFGFIDDVEFLVDLNAKKIHMRSASRLGYSDLGANLSRVEKLRTLFAQIAKN